MALCSVISAVLGWWRYGARREGAGAIRMSERGRRGAQAGAVVKGPQTVGARSPMLLAIGVAAMVAGCATTTGGGLTAVSPAAEKEKVVAERANARWQALINRDYKAAYEYLSQASRDAMPLTRFQAQLQTIEHRAVTIEKVECAAEVCKVMLKLTYDFPPAKIKGVVTPGNEDWIIERGSAWYVVRG
jgi:hypothetical protein